MSLINEALKKAQKLRDAESAVQGPARPAASPPATPPPPSPPGSSLQLHKWSHNKYALSTIDHSFQKLFR